MFQQYRQLKAAYGDALLLFRLGDFYELFGEDARLGASVLGITLTSREIGKGRRVPMCGVPYHAADGYIAELVRAGHRVAICEQMEDPKLARGVVRREVIRVITPGTWTGETGRERRYLAAVYVADGMAGVAFADLSTGELRATRLAPGSDPSWGGPEQALVEELRRLGATEVLVPPPLESPIRQSLGAADGSPVVTAWDGGPWDLPAARRVLLDHFGVASLEAFGIERWPQAQVAAGVALAYMRETQKDRLVHITSLESYDPGAGLVIDPTSALNLELTLTLRQRSRRGSLLDVLDETLTGPGARLLRRYVEEPLTDPGVIHERLERVDRLFHDHLLRGRLRAALKGLPDAQRLLGRCGTGRATPKDLVALRQFLQQGQAALATAQALVDRPPDERLVELAQTLERALVEDPPAQARDGGYIRRGYDSHLDELRQGAEDARSWIAGLEQRERERTGIRSLKVGFNRVFGYYLEVTRPNLKLVPPEYERRQTLTGAERFVTPELKEKESQVLNAEEAIATLEAQIFTTLVDRVLELAPSIQELARELALLDVAASLAEVAVRRGWTRPAVDDGDVIEIRRGRHPMVEASLSESPFVPNDVYLDTRSHRLAIVTGPNMGGKSTFLRQTALIVILAQMGSFVPAAHARIGIVDRVMARVGASDDLASGRSTFMVEMGETAYMLRHATRRSLVILDEVGRGTATYDGLSLAWAIVEALHELGARTLVATHYHELTELEGRLEGVFNVHAAVAQTAAGIAFLRQIRPGAADRSYGLEVARLAGIPEAVVGRAREILERLEGAAVSPLQSGAGTPALAAASDGVARPERAQGPRPQPRSRRSVAELAQGSLF
ncbi:DNA mismatch repair protein MutS [Carboxydochorda subterranea]|uniref:DNA mismatch repair protein MutS n=1 Tax=Carboxydichorda subterranea TaxID=3109565 RepID=A0ABZ1C1F1_9FIRM|nr:DNA mismatch repair protein MutS [Limnochorda sp. L945t]WRP18924.1 DNA mismatch repair protein MutS [Limnochorda sp. L945t]